MVSKTNRTCYAWSITYQEVDKPNFQLFTPNQVEDCLHSLGCKNYAFQLERSKSGRLHYQISLLLKGSSTSKSIIGKFRTHSKLTNDKDFLCFAPGCLTVRPSHSASKSSIYCMKDETRVDGPWVFPKNTYVGKDLYSPSEFYPWQSDIYNYLMHSEPSDREILCIVDKFGKTGKSMFAKYLSFKHDATVLPLGLNSAQMKAAIVNNGPSRIYLVDIPRNSRKSADIYDCLEEVKRGFVISSYYGKLEKMYMERPFIIVFTNYYPDIIKMSFDMWSIYEVNDSHTLTPVDKTILSFKQRSKSKSPKLKEYNNNLDYIDLSI